MHSGQGKAEHLPNWHLQIRLEAAFFSIRMLACGLHAASTQMALEHGLKGHLVWNTGAAPAPRCVPRALEWWCSLEAALPSSADFTMSSGGCWGSLSPWLL